MRQLYCVSLFESYGYGILENVNKKPSNSMNLGGDLTFNLDNGLLVTIHQQCFALCLRYYLGMKGKIYSDKDFVELLNIDISKQGEPFSQEKIQQTAIITNLNIEINDIGGTITIKPIHPSINTIKLWLEFGHYELILDF